MQKNYLKKYIQTSNELEIIYHSYNIAQISTSRLLYQQINSVKKNSLIPKEKKPELIQAARASSKLAQHGIFALLDTKVKHLEAKLLKYQTKFKKR